MAFLLSQLALCMQKIVRSPRLTSTLSSADYACSQALQAAGPAHLFNLFACIGPADDGHWQWQSPLPGQVRPFMALSVVEQQQLLKALALRKNQLADYAEALASRDQQETAALLQKLLRHTDVSCLYSIDQQPVVIDWHDAALLQPALIPSAADSAALVMAANAAKPVYKTAAAGRAAGWLRLLLFAGLFALGLVIVERYL